MRTPLLAVDSVIFFEGGVVLIRRLNPPFQGCYALPGGFVEVGESTEEAVVREAREETGLEVTGLLQFHTYSDPGRDARLHTASTVFIGRADGVPQAGDDAGEVGLFSRDNLPDLAFDHATILADYYSGRYRRMT